MSECQGCGLCKYHIYMSDGEYMCDNEKSIAYGLSTDLDDYCESYMSKYSIFQWRMLSYFLKYQEKMLKDNYLVIKCIKYGR